MSLRPNYLACLALSCRWLLTFCAQLLKTSKTTHWRAITFNCRFKLSPLLVTEATTGNFILYNFAQCKVRRIPKSGNFWSVESGIWKSFTCKIWNPGLWNLWFNSRNPESCWQLESRWKFHIWQVLRKAVPEMCFHRVESRIQDCLGFLYYVNKSHVRLLFVDKKMLQISL